MRLLPGVVAPFALIATISCAPSLAALPSEPPYINGTITSIGRIAEGWSVRVEERPQDVTGSAKGVFHVGDRADVRRASGGRARVDELREGQRVRVWVAGPVMESYPVQATARLVVIEAEAP
jgi:hypothetical protein